MLQISTRWFTRLWRCKYVWLLLFAFFQQKGKMRFFDLLCWCTTQRSPAWCMDDDEIQWMSYLLLGSSIACVVGFVGGVGVMEELFRLQIWWWFAFELQWGYSIKLVNSCSTSVLDGLKNNEFLRLLCCHQM